MYKSLCTMVVALGAAAVLSGSASAAEAVPAANSAEASKPPKTVQVQSGDSLSLIAQAQALESWVPLWNANTSVEHPDMIYPGQQLVVPEGPTPERPLPAGAIAQPAPVAAVQQPVRSNGAVRSAAPANYAAGAGGILARIRQKESGGNYATNTGNGYYGAYQFDLQTWRGVGGSGLPSQASPAEQDMRAQMLYDRRGCNPWPNTCS
jgi:LysM repeat protein